MAREDRTRDLSLLDRENLRSGVDIGAELFGIGPGERVTDRTDEEIEHEGRDKEECPSQAAKTRSGQEEEAGAIPSGTAFDSEAALPEEPPETTTVPKNSNQPRVVSEEPSREAAVKEPAPPRITEPEPNRVYQEQPKETPQPERFTAPGNVNHQSYRREPELREEYRYRYPALEKPEPGFKTFRHLMVNVYSPKGGVGKSSISKELAVAYSTASINQTPLKVLIVDADWEFGDISTLFNVPSRPNVTDWIRDMMKDKRQTGHIHLYSRQEIAARYIIPYHENLHILAGPGDPTEAELVTEEMVTAILESLKRSDYDIIIIDSANSNRMRSLIPLMKADAVVLVETLDTSTVAETTAVLNTLRTQQFDFSKLYMVLNQAPNEDTSMDISVTEISRLLQLDIAAVIPRYEMLRMINNAGEAAVQKKATPYSRAIFQLANRIVPVFEQEKKKGILSGVLGLFGRRQ